MYIFPGLGLGVVACQAEGVTDKMLFTAAMSLASTLTPELLAQGKIFPRLSDIRVVSQQIALDVIKEAKKEGLNSVVVPDTDEEIRETVIKPNVWEPHYGQLIYPYSVSK